MTSIYCDITAQKTFYSTLEKHLDESAVIGSSVTGVCVQAISVHLEVALYKFLMFLLFLC